MSREIQLTEEYLNDLASRLAEKKESINGCHGETECRGTDESEKPAASGRKIEWVRK